MLRGLRPLHEIAARLDRGELDARGFLLELTRSLCRTLGCSRTSVWVYAQGQSETGQPPEITARRWLRCLARFDADEGRLMSADAIDVLAHAKYVDVLMRQGQVLASHAASDELLRELWTQHLRHEDVRSVLDVALNVNGTPVGLLRCEQTGDGTQWRGEQVQLLKAVGARAALSLLRDQRRPLDTAPGALWEPSDPAHRITRAMPLVN